MTPIRVMPPDDAPRVIDVLCESFREYPVMRYVIGPGEEYTERLHTLVAFFVEARIHRNEVLLGLGSGDRLDGAALISRPGGPSPSALRDLRDAVWDELGAEARARYESYGAATRAFAVGAPHIHLNMIGVRDASKGAGHGRALLEHVHRYSVEDAASTGVSLTTESPDNVPLYQHFGYEIIGHARVSPELESWGFFRED